MSGEDPRARYARDLNCLVDEDRNKRRRALGTFATVFVSGSKALTPDLSSYFASDCLAPLLKVVADPVEKNRELAVALIADVFSANAALHVPVAAATLPVLSARLGTVPFPEPAEEVRLQLVKLLRSILNSPHCPGVVGDAFDSVSETLLKAATDSYHDVKVRFARAVPPLTAALAQLCQN